MVQWTQSPKMIRVAEVEVFVSSTKLRAGLRKFPRASDDTCIALPHPSFFCFLRCLVFVAVDTQGYGTPFTTNGFYQNLNRNKRKKEPETGAESRQRPLQQTALLARHVAESLSSFSPCRNCCHPHVGSRFCDRTQGVHMNDGVDISVFEDCPLHMSCLWRQSNEYRR